MKSLKSISTGSISILSPVYSYYPVLVSYIQTESKKGHIINGKP